MYKLTGSLQSLEYKNNRQAYTLQSELCVTEMETHGLCTEAGEWK